MLRGMRPRSRCRDALALCPIPDGPVLNPVAAHRLIATGPPPVGRQHLAATDLASGGNVLVQRSPQLLGVLGAHLDLVGRAVEAECHSSSAGLPSMSSSSRASTLRVIARPPSVAPVRRPFLHRAIAGSGRRPSRLGRGVSTFCRHGVTVTGGTVVRARNILEPDRHPVPSTPGSPPSRWARLPRSGFRPGYLPIRG